MLTMLRRWWNRHRRATDLEILWPECVNMTDGDMVAARAAFLFHTELDPAWSDLTLDERRRIVDRLR
jgi:hypothetical protein